MTASLSHDDLGSGPTLLLLHAYPLDRRLWRGQREPLSRAARLLVPDLRGFGASTGRADARRLEDHADDLAQLLDEARVDRAILCGVSMGGYIALAFLERHPDRLAGLVLCNTRAGADTPEAAAGRRANAERALAEGTWAVAEALLPRMLSARTRSEKPGLAGELESIVRDQPPAGVAAALRAMAARPDRSGLLPAVRVPALVVSGDSDPLIPAAESGAMADLIPGASHRVFPGTAHLANFEEPEAFNATLLDFLAAV